MVIQDPRSRRLEEAQRNRAVLEVILLIYSVIVTFILTRTVVILLNTPERVWVGRTVLGMPSIVIDPLLKVPGLSTRLYGPLTLLDILLLALVILFPLGLMATAIRR